MRLHPVSSIQYSQKYNAKMAHLAEIIFDASALASGRPLITSSPRFRALPSRCLRTATIPQGLCRRPPFTLTPQMKSVDEAMAIGRTFKESPQKCLRSLEIGQAPSGAKSL
jgi:hypothetical protein